MSNENHCPLFWSVPVVNLVLALPSMAFAGVSLELDVEAVATHPARGKTVGCSWAEADLAPSSATAAPASNDIVPAHDLRYTPCHFVIRRVLSFWFVWTDFLAFGGRSRAR